MENQQGDVLLFQTDDGGELTVTAGVVRMTGGLETAAYLSLFGGNEDDDGRTDNPYQYWANYNENETAYKYRSETQHLLQALEAIPANLRRIEQAAVRDLAWIDGATVTVEARIPGLNRVAILVSIEINGAQYRFAFNEPWQAA